MDQQSELLLRSKDLPALFTGDALKWTFARRPVPVAGDLRITWRSVLLLLTLRLCCHGGRSSIRRLHVLNWATRTTKARMILSAALRGERRSEDVIVRLDPALNIVLVFARAENLVSLKKGDRVHLTQLGQMIADEVLTIPNCLESEKTFLRSLERRVTEEWTSSLFQAKSHLS